MSGLLRNLVTVLLALMRYGSVTVNPGTLLGTHQLVKPAYLTAWDDMLASINN